MQEVLQAERRGGRARQRRRRVGDTDSNTPPVKHREDEGENERPEQANQYNHWRKQNEI